MTSFNSQQKVSVRMSPRLQAMAAMSTTTVARNTAMISTKITTEQCRTTRRSTMERDIRGSTSTALQSTANDNNEDLQPDKVPSKTKKANAKTKRKVTPAQKQPSTKKRAKSTTTNNSTTTATTTSSGQRRTTKSSISMASSTNDPELVESNIPIPVTPESSSSSSLITTNEESMVLKKVESNKKKSKPITKKQSSSSSSKKQPHKRSSPPPKEDWQLIYRLVEELRADRTAPVDNDGSEALPQRELGESTYRFQVLIALMLSSQTKDAVVGEAIRKLQHHGLTLDNIRNNTSYDQLNALIGKVGFHNTKAKNILKVADILHDPKYGDDIPPTAQDMIRDLPGVGPKMAYIVENVAWGTTTGIGIDTHMHRMFNQLQWVQSTQPEQTRLQLESWLPFEYWSDINLLWVGLGQEVQQYPEKILNKAMASSQPKQALLLLQRLGMNLPKVATKMGQLEQVQATLANGPIHRQD